MTRVTLVVNRHDAVSETFQRALASMLAEGGHQVTLHALRPGGAPASIAGVATSSGLPPMRAGSLVPLAVRAASGRQPGLMAAVQRARRTFGATERAARAALVAGPILGTEPEVVHLGFSGIGVAIEDALDLLAGVRLVVSCRGTDELVRPLLDPDRAEGLARLVRRVDRVHVVASAIGDAVVALGADPAAVRVIRPAVDLDRWPVRDAPPLGPTLTLLVVARLQPAKGIEDALAALAIVRDGGFDARLRIVGDGPHRDALRLRVARAGLGDHVDLVGSLAPAAVRAEVATADLYISASLSEGISNGVLEAMATGVPVLSTDVGGMAEVITDGIDGGLVAPGRPDRLAVAVAALLADPGGRRDLAAAGRRRVEAAFGRSRQRAEWLAVYDELAMEPGGAPSSSVERSEGT